MQFQQDFFTNKRGLLTHFANMWQTVASYMQDEPNLLGYELLNEPIGANAYKNIANVLQPGVSNMKFLLPAYKILYKAIRAVDSKTIIFFEPSVLDFLS
jgi:endoglycosylceramidase